MDITRTLDKTKIPHILWLLAFIIALPAIFLASTGRMNFLVLYIGSLFVTSVVVFPRASFYLFLLSISVYYPTFIGRFALHPFDVCFALFIVAVILDHLLNCHTYTTKTKLDLPFIVLIVATVISAVFAYNQSYSIVPTFRIITIYRLQSNDSLYPQI